MANGKPGYSSRKATLPGGRAMYEMPVFGAPGRNRLGQTPAQAAAAKKAVAANLLLPEERRYMSPDLGESPTMKSERLEGERMGRERGTTVPSRRRETQGRGARPQSANMKRFLALKKQKDRERARGVQRRRTDDQFM